MMALQKKEIKFVRRVFDVILAEIVELFEMIFYANLSADMLLKQAQVPSFARANR